MSLFSYAREHNWFAWHPVRLDDHRLVWLRTVRRRRCYVDAFPSPDFWTYRPKEPR